MANKQHVECLKSGVEAWNKWRKENPGEIPDLKGADLNGADLRFANLSGANLSGANLIWANLRRTVLFRANLSGASLSNVDLRLANLLEAKLQKADLRSARLKCANFYMANLRGAQLSQAELQKVDLRGANLRGAKLGRADLSNAKLGGADLRRANLMFASLENTSLIGTNLQGADLRRARGLILSGTLVKGTQFQASANDPWSVLRRIYSGPRLIINLLLLVAFLIPYGAKVLFWIAVNRMQIFSEAAVGEQASVLGMDADKVSNFSRCFAEHCDPMPVWELMLGVDKGWSFWTLAIALILYNTLKTFLTLRVSPMRDEEDWSGYSPHWTACRDASAAEIQEHVLPNWTPNCISDLIPNSFWIWYWKKTFWARGYRFLFWVHQYFVRWVFAVAVIALAYNAWGWLSRIVWIPD